MGDELSEKWAPMPPDKGPPLPQFLNILWPWYKGEEEPEEPPSAGAYECPYCDESFGSIAELIGHVAEAHPDKPPIGEIDIQWE